MDRAGRLQGVGAAFLPRGGCSCRPQPVLPPRWISALPVLCSFVPRRTRTGSSGGPSLAVARPALSQSITCRAWAGCGVAEPSAEGSSGRCVRTSSRIAGAGADQVTTRRGRYPNNARSPRRPVLRPVRARFVAGFRVSGAEEGRLQVQLDQLLGLRECRHVQRDGGALGQHARRGVDPVRRQRDRADGDGRRRGLLGHGRHAQLCGGRDLQDVPGHDRRQRHCERPEQDDRVQALQRDAERLADQVVDSEADDHRQRGTRHAGLQREHLHRGGGRRRRDDHGEPDRRVESEAQRRLRDPDGALEPRDGGQRLHGDQPGADAHVQPRRGLKDLPGRDRRRLQCGGPRERGPRALQSAEPDRRRGAPDRPERAGGADDQRRRRVDVQVQRARLSRRRGRRLRPRDDHRQPRRRDQHSRGGQLLHESRERRLRAPTTPRRPGPSTSRPARPPRPST